MRDNARNAAAGSGILHTLSTVAFATTILTTIAGVAHAQQGQSTTTLDTITVQGGQQTQPQSNQPAAPAAPAGPAEESDPAPAPETAWGPVDGYIATRSATGIKTDTPIREIPQSISVVGRQQMVDQGATSVQDTLRYVPGVFTEAYGFDIRGDWARIRGADPVEYLDGMRRFYGFYNNTRPDPYTLERVEVLKGPASVLYGQGSTGGILNLVSKRPQTESKGEIGVQYGTFDRAQVQADFTGKLTKNGKLLYRIIGVTRDSDTQVDFVNDDRYVFSPAITWLPDENTSLTIIANFQKDESGSTSAFLPWEGTLFAGPNGFIPWSRFTSEPGFDAYDTESASVTALFERKLNETWTFRQNVRYSESSVNYQSLYPDVYTNPQNPFVDPQRRSVNRYSYVSKPDAENFTSDTNAVAEFSTGRIEHKALFGFDYSRYDESGLSGGGYITTPFDLYDPEYGNFTEPVLARNPDVTQTQRGFYAQDQMKFGNWIAVLGMRRDLVINRTQGAEDERHAANTYRAGLMYEFANGLTPYVSYSESFTPVAGTDVNSQPYDPLAGVQYEVGFKYQPAGRDVLINASLFDITESNRLAPDPTNPLNQIQIGEAQSRGGEIEAIFGIGDRIDVITGYAYVDAEITQGTNAGSRVPTVPEHQASLWATYQFSLFGHQGFSLGGGVRYVGDSWDGTDSLKTPSYTLFDAMLAYETEDWRFQINGTNLGDKEYLTTCLSRGDCFLGTSRTVIAGVTRKF